MQAYYPASNLFELWIKRALGVAGHKLVGALREGAGKPSGLKTCRFLPVVPAFPRAAKERYFTRVGEPGRSTWNTGAPPVGALSRADT
jgi:hypothetical protein